MSKKLISLFISLSILVSMTSSAKEPLNLSVLKEKIISYHDSHAYEKDINNVINQALRYLSFRIEQHFDTKLKPAIILDIDETALSNYPDLVKLDFSRTEEAAKKESLGKDPVIEPTLKLYRYAKEHHIAVFFITGRDENERVGTMQNLLNVGYKDWDGMFLRSGQQKKMTAATFKTSVRKYLTEQGYQIIMNLGDQKSDLVGGYADKTFKLPNPFYLIQ